jgi:transcriptional regulator GlxA family with amidase domain
LARQNATAAPGNVKRAEAFMHANAGTPLTILQQARLEQARTGMLRAGQMQSLARIAAEYGFSSPTRFAQSFRRKYGVYPSEMLRESGHILAG